MRTRWPPSLHHRPSRLPCQRRWQNSPMCCLCKRPDLMSAPSPAVPSLVSYLAVIRSAFMSVKAAGRAYRLRVRNPDGYRIPCFVQALTVRHPLRVPRDRDGQPSLNVPRPDTLMITVPAPVVGCASAPGAGDSVLPLEATGVTGFEHSKAPH